MKGYIGVTLCMVFLAIGCVTVNRLGTDNLSYLYSDQTNSASLKFTAFNLSKSKTKVFYELNLSSFLYEKPDGESNFSSRFKIRYELFDAFKGGNRIDSGSFVFTDSLYYGVDKIFNHDFEVKTIYPGDFVLNLVIEDLNRKKSFMTFLEISNQSDFSRENFIKLNASNEIIYEDYIRGDQAFRIRTNSNDYSKFLVRYYNRDFPIAVPPFVEDERKTFRYRADSIFVININNGITDLITLVNHGFYHFQIDTSSRDGLTVFRYYDDFPAVNEAEHMLMPLKYLTTKKELEKLEQSPNIKNAVDDFWIENSGNQDRAKVMIQKYYTRVQDANQYFSSYLEGWKTDRGIIYIVQGTPNVVYRDTNYEQWIYGEEGNIMSITFNFVKVNNPFTNNDFLLDKSPVYKETWYRAVNNWRR